MVFGSLHFEQRTFFPANLSETRYAVLHFLHLNVITTNYPSFCCKITIFLNGIWAYQSFGVWYYTCIVAKTQEKLQENLFFWVNVFYFFTFRRINERFFAIFVT